MRRGNLARLLQSSKKGDASSDLKGLEQESSIARNKVMLEHVVATRNMRGWREQILEELHLEQRNAKSVGNARQRKDQVELHFKHDQLRVPQSKEYNKRKQ